MSGKCGQGLADTAAQIIRRLTELPELPDSWSINKTTAANKVAQEFCRQELGYDYQEAHRRSVGFISDEVIVAHSRSSAFSQDLLVNADSGPLTQFNLCVSRKASKLIDFKHPSIPSLDKALETAKELRAQFACLRPDARAQLLCPVVALTVSGSLAPNVAFRVIAAAKASRSVRFLEEQLQGASRKAVQLSYLHQIDLIKATESPAFKEAGGKLNLDMTALQRGIERSDLGKDMRHWNTTFLRDDPQADRIREIFMGRGEGPAAELMQDILKKHFDNRPLLPPSMNASEARAYLLEHGPLRGFGHELPGAWQTLEQYEVDLAKLPVGSPRREALRLRAERELLANFGHNGPNAGFAEVFGGTIIPGYLQSRGLSIDPWLETAYAAPNGRRALAFFIPKSKEGLIHTAIDRGSQGSRGGIEKIFFEQTPPQFEAARSTVTIAEVGNIGRTPALNTLYDDLMTSNVVNSRLQLRKLREAINDSEVTGYLITSERQALSRYVEQLDQRLGAQSRFLESGTVRAIRDSEGTDPSAISRLEFHYTNAAGEQVVDLVTQNSTLDQMFESFNRLMDAEARLNGGDPLQDLGRNPALVRPQVLQNALNGSLASQTSPGPKTAIPSACLPFLGTTQELRQVPTGTVTSP